MTRGEALRQSEIISRNEAMFNCGVLDNISAKTSTELVKEIYDDFEKQTCNNCKFHTSSTNSTFALCDKNVFDDFLPDNLDEAFGCNKFEK